MKRPKNIVFITGTDTGVGKTAMTGMLLHYLREHGCHALAMKPFCSGSHADVDILRLLQDDELLADEINPYYFPDPVAPVASRAKRKQRITASAVAAKIFTIAQKCDLLLVEGCGGLKVPISQSLLLVDVIAELGCRVLLVGPNKLGVLNHVLLSIEALRTRGLKQSTVALVNQESPDASAKTNARVLAKILHPTPIFPVAFLGRELDKAHELKGRSKAVGKIAKHITREMN